jgi:type I restriction enzyme S subunit
MTELPRGWSWVTLEEAMSECRNGLTYRNNPELAGFPVSRIETISKGEIDFEKVGYGGVALKGNEKHLMKAGDILFSHINSMIHVGKVAIYKSGMPELLHGMNLLRITPKGDFIPEFLFHLLQSNDVRKQIWAKAKHAVNQASINIRELKTVVIPKPPINEQLKIVELLEDHLSHLDAALTDVNQAKIKAIRFRRSLLLSLMSPDFGGSSGDWSRTTLGRVCDLVAGKTPPSLESSISGIDDSSRTVPFYKVGDMNLDSEFLCKSRLYLSTKQVEDRKLFVLPIGSVVFPKTGGAIATNKKRVISVPGPIDLNCMAAIPIQGTNPKYLSWWFQSINLSTYADGSILPQLSKGKMSEIPVDWPNQELQEEIVMNLEQSLSNNSEAIKLTEAIEANSLSLRRSLLQAAFTGQLTKEVVSV